MNKKHKKVCKNSNYIEHWKCFHFCFASLVGIPGNIVAITAGIASFVVKIKFIQ